MRNILRTFLLQCHTFRPNIVISRRKYNHLAASFFVQNVIEHVIYAAIHLVVPHESFGENFPHSLKLIGYQAIGAERKLRE